MEGRKAEGGRRKEEGERRKEEGGRRKEENCLVLGTAIKPNMKKDLAHSKKQEEQQAYKLAVEDVTCLDHKRRRAEISPLFAA